MAHYTRWTVEYSFTKKDFRIKELHNGIQENLDWCLQGTSDTYQLLGIFEARETAHTFCESLKYKLEVIEVHPEEIPFFLISKATKQSLSYDLVLSLICAELSKKSEGYLKQFCQEHSLPLPQMSSLLKDPRYCLEAALLVVRILVSLNYVVKMTAVVLFEEKDIENGREEISYYFTKKSSKNPLLTYQVDQEKSPT